MKVIVAVGPRPDDLIYIIKAGENFGWLLVVGRWFPCAPVAWAVLIPLLIVCGGLEFKLL